MVKQRLDTASIYRCADVAVLLAHALFTLLLHCLPSSPALLEIEPFFNGITWLRRGNDVMEKDVRGQTTPINTAHLREQSGYWDLQTLIIVPYA